MIPTEVSEVQLAEKLQQLRDNLNGVIRGKEDVVNQAIVALLAGGSILLEDVPGVGKTTLAKGLAASVDLKYQRVQCTPDLLPADIFGFSVFNPKEGTFEFRPGPIFCHVLLVDEINRASPRTQSALLEAMAEQQVTVEGVRYPLESPFMVLATQNPLGFQGTFPLPESQLDRFLLKLSMDYPDASSEVDILYDHLGESEDRALSPVLSREEVIQCQQMVRAVRVERNVADYIVEIVRRTRSHSQLQLGSSPRGSLMLFRATQAQALASGRSFVLPDDVLQVAPMVLPHRVVAARSSGRTSGETVELIEGILKEVEIPV